MRKMAIKPTKYKFRGKQQPSGAIGKIISCDGKIRWWSKESATRHADECNSRLIGDRKVRTYKCRFSPKDNIHWHVGREPAK